VAREITVEAVLNALGRVNYPGYATDIVSLGVIEAVEPLETGGGFAVVVRQATERDEVIHELAGAINGTLTRDLGVPRVELRVRRRRIALTIHGWSGCRRSSRQTPSPYFEHGDAMLGERRISASIESQTMPGLTFDQLEDFATESISPHLA